MIVIIGMIAALIFPVLAKARGAAEKTTCISNLRELALASSIYLHDNDDRMFPYGYNSGSRFLTWWGDLITGEARARFDLSLYEKRQDPRMSGRRRVADKQSEDLHHGLRG